MPSTPPAARSSSCWPAPCSWCALNTPMPIVSSAAAIAVRASSPRSEGEKSKYEPASTVRVVGDAVGVALEEIELDFERRLHVAHHVFGVVDHALERAARAAFERRAVGHRDVAQHARFGCAGIERPRQDRERRRIRPQQHVEFFLADEPVDRAAVERHAAVHRAFEFADRDRDVLLDARDVDEREANPLHPAVARGLYDVAAHVARVLNCREHRWRWPHAT